jgi:acyl transferase domain-containing protein/NAD(P)H-dependent flavin oxidoreductase YrpB (nitropropane dioxygenase family)
MLEMAIEDAPGGAPPVDMVVLSVPAQAPDGPAVALDGTLAGWVRRLRNRRVDVLLEVTALAQAELAGPLGATGLVARGNEAGGRVAEETAFVLLGLLLARTTLPVWAHGGIGLHSAAGCYTAGAAGIVLDDQLLLVDESPLPAAVRALVARMDGTETALVGGEFRLPVRVWLRRDAAPARRLQALASELASRASESVDDDGWQRTVTEAAGWASPETDVLPLGQAAAFAAPLAERFGTVVGVLGAFADAVPEHIRSAQKSGALRAGAPLARAHRTRYPLVQGPMTRVSDQPAFAAAVADAGALPFLALALMRGEEVAALLAKTSRLLGDRPWGIGILGFVPQELRDEQIAAVLGCAPKFALIAGGRPDQARTLEDAGIPTYLHVASPALLRYFAESGTRRFVLEGRECGGHVGPRSSFMLWDSAIEELTNVLDPRSLVGCHVLLAGGIHDAASAAAAAIVAAPLTAVGAKVGLLLGTAYVFTDEAVACGAVTPRFQRAAIDCSSTVLLESGPGHATRCAPSPFVETFRQEGMRLSGVDADSRREALDAFSLGRLRIAAKGIRRSAPPASPEGHGPALETVPEAAQWSDGLFMLGQVAAARQASVPLAELHRQVCEEGDALLAATPVPVARVPRPGTRRPDVAIVGMSCLLPGARNLPEYWDNIVNGVDAVREVPEARWSLHDYYDPDPTARDKVYSRWGGFLDDVPFDPMRYGIPPKALASIEPAQLLTLEAVRAALADSGLGSDCHRGMGGPVPPELMARTSVILGAGGGIADLGQRYAIRSGLPLVLDADDEVYDRLPEWTEDSFAGILLNVLAGRVANRFDFGGVNFTVDAACASSLAAVHLGARELTDGTSDLVLAGGVDTVQNPFGYLCFAKTHALSPTGKCRAFDKSADGIVISEGVVILVLKRLADAERTGDRVYAVLKATAGASDGRTNGITAPSPAGQVRALRQAYARAGVSPATVGLVEAHGTGTVAGDCAEIESLLEVFGEVQAAPGSCAIGSVKSMIGHTKCAAGAAGLAKAALALHHKVLPPTLHVLRPNEQLRPGSPFYVNSLTRPWLSPESSPRRAAVSAFGFGGINFHAVLEEHRRRSGDADRSEAPTRSRFPSELLTWAAGSSGELGAEIERFLARMGDAGCDSSVLTTLASAAWKTMRDRGPTAATPPARLAIVADSMAALRDALKAAYDALASGSAVRPVPQATVELRLNQSAGPAGQLAYLYPGQGSQRVEMLRELTVTFPSVRRHFEAADDLLAERFPGGLTQFIFPPPRFERERQDAAEAALTRTDVAQPALAAAEMAVTKLLAACGLRPDMVAGHSFGEYVALWCAGVFDDQTLLRLSEERGRLLLEASGTGDGAMAAIAAGADAVPDMPGVWIANQNGPAQTVIAGRSVDIDAAIATLHSRSVHAVRIPVGCAFHSPLVSAAAEPLAQLLRNCEFRVPTLRAFSNTTGGPHSNAAADIRELLTRHMLAPVRFGDEIESMYAAGARTFVEVGPKGVLTGLASRILHGRPHDAVETDRDGAALRQFQVVLAKVFAAGHAINLDPLFGGREERWPGLHVGPDRAARTEDSSGWVIRDGRCVAAAPVSGDVPDRGGAAAAAREPARDRSGGESAELVPAAQHAPAPSAPQAAVLSGPDGYGWVGSSHLPPSAGRPADGPDHMVGDADEIVTGFQQVMTRFLETQREVMLAWLAREQAQEGTADGETVRPEALVEQPEPPTQPQPDPRARSEDELPRAELPLGPAAQSAEGNTGRLSEAEQDRAARDGLSASEVLAELTRIVSERTGYPAEILDPDQDMESDLGMDSIKRVEILATLVRGLPGSAMAVEGSAMETLTRLRTLRGIADTVADQLVPTPSGTGDGGQSGPDPAVVQQHAPAARNPQPEPGGTVAGQNRVPGPLTIARFVVEPAPSDPKPHGGHGPEPVIIITDDAGGIADQLATALNQRGDQAVVVPAPLADRASATNLVSEILKQHGEVRTLVHLPRKRSAAEDIAQWRACVAGGAGTLLHLVQALATPADPGILSLTRVLAAAPLGLWPDDADGSASGGPAAASPVWGTADGVVTGMVRTLAREFPATKCRIIDLDPAEHSEVVVGRLLDELALDDQPEVAYRNGRRYRPRLRPASHASATGEATLLPNDRPAVLLVTGGARGITAQVAEELAAAFKPLLVLVGRTPLPEQPEDLETADITDPRRLRAALMAAASSQGRGSSAREVESDARRLLRQREIRATLQAVRRQGAAAEYLSVDLADPNAVRSLVSDVYSRHGHIDAVIHGAGILEDRLLADKDLDSLHRVLSAKAESALLIADSLDPETTRAYLLFSSVAGLFGNAGQADYAGANVVLDQLARNLDARWPGRVAALAWGPWAAGMVSAEMQDRFRRRGVQVIDPTAGRVAFLAEFAQPVGSASQVVLGDGPWSTSAPDPAAQLFWPLLTGATAARSAGRFAVERKLSVRTDRFLDDHRIDGRPVLPAAFVLELFAETLSAGWPASRLSEIREFRVLSGVILDHDEAVVRIEAVVAREDADGPCIIGCTLSETEGPVRYRAEALLAPPSEESPNGVAASSLPVLPMPDLTVTEMQDRWLFHGPLLRGVASVQGIGTAGVRAMLRSSEPAELVTGGRGKWASDPLVIDGAFQLAIIWARSQLDMTPLPAGFARYQQLRSLSASEIRCELRASPSSDGHLLLTDITFSDGANRALARLTGMEFACSGALNRLGGAR